MTYNTIWSIQEFLKEKPGYKKKGNQWLANYLDTSESLVAEAKGELKANKPDYTGYDQKENHQNDNDNRLNNYTAAQDQTLEEYCESVGLNPEKIDKYNDVKYWTDSAGRRRYSIVPKDIQQAEDTFKQEILSIITDATPKATIEPLKQFSALTNNLGLINLYDCHFDKISEIGEGYTIEDNCDIVRKAFGKLLSPMSAFKPEVIVLPIGNDFFNTNDFRNTTKAGTQQELSVHWKQSFQIGITLLRELIDGCSAHCGKVVVIPIEGNHDEDKVFYLNEVLKAAYSNESWVEFRDESAPRHYISYGQNLLGFGHGKYEKSHVKDLPLFMAEEAPKDWGNTSYREFFLGDIHHKDQTRFTRSKDYKGCTVTFLRDITMNHSSWDRGHGYHTGNKTIESYIFNEAEGQIANFKFNI